MPLSSISIVSLIHLIEVTQNFSTLQTSMVSAGRVFALIDETNYEPVQENGQAEIREGISVLNMCPSLMTENTRFLMISPLPSIKVKPSPLSGILALGKSSIINVLMRFYEFQSGRVLLDGVDIREYSQEELRKTSVWFYRTLPLSWDH